MLLHSVTTQRIELTICQFHRGEYTVRDVKDYLAARGFLVRHFEAEL